MNIENKIEEILGKIRDARTTKGKSQSWMADRLGVAQNTYKDIENGKTKLRIEVLLEITQILDIDIAELFTDETRLHAIREKDIQNMREDIKEIKESIKHFSGTMEYFSKKMHTIDKLEQIFNKMLPQAGEEGGGESDD